MNNKFDDFINAHPRESLQLLIVVLFLCWQSIPAVLGCILYLLLIKKLNVKWWQVLVIGLVFAFSALFFQEYVIANRLSVADFIKDGFDVNWKFWSYLLADQPVDGALYLLQHGINYIMGLPMLLVGLLATANLIAPNPHKLEMENLQKGIITEEKPELDDNKIEKALKKLDDAQHDGTLLGVSKYTGDAVSINDRDVNQCALVLGTTGSGKTVTLRRFYQRAITKGYPLIIIDGKPDDENINWLTRQTLKYERPFFGFNCANYLPYDPLSNSGFTSLKDKIISLKDQWSSDHYKSIAEDYLQATFQILLQEGKQLDLKRVVDCLSYEKLSVIARSINDEKLFERINALKQYDRSDITGLQAHLNILIHSELGKYFEKNNDTFSLQDVINENGVVYFALPALEFPSFSKVLGKLVINDIKATIAKRKPNSTPIFTVFDEFSVFAGEQVLNLVNMGRGKGLHAIFGTQGLADLARVDANFKEQVLNCVNTIICHRLNDKTSTDAIAYWVGTKDKIGLTSQVNAVERDAKMGTLKRDRGFMIHPDMIKQSLQIGEAFYTSKVGSFRWDKVRVLNSI